VANQSVPRVLTPSNGSDDDTPRRPGREILQRVHRQIDTVLEKGIIDLLSEKRPAAQSGEGDLGSEIPGGLDLDPLGFSSGSRQLRTGSLRLPQSQRTASGTDPERSRDSLQRNSAAETPPLTGSTPKSLLSREAARSPEAMASPSEIPSR
jgi:hypothetical protein